MAATRSKGRSTGSAAARSGAAPLSAAGGTLIEAMPVPVFVRGADGALIGCNSAFTAAYGTLDALAPDTTLPADAAPGTVREARLTGRDGAAHDVLLHLNRFADPATGLSGQIGVVVDVTDRKQAERGLEDATIKLEEAYRTGRLGYWEYGIHTGTLVWNAGAFEIFGQDPATFEPTFDHLLEILHPDDRLSYGTMLESVIGNPKRAYVEFRARGADGRTRYISSSCAPRYDRHGRLSHVFGVMLDTTEQAEAAAQLQAAKLRLEEAHRTGRLGYWEYGIHTGALELNAEAFAIYGQNAETFEPTFDGLLNILHPDDRLRFGNMLEGVIGNSRRVYFEYRVIDPVGEVRTVSSSCAPRFDAEQRLTHVFGVMLDTTERARAAAALRAAKEEAEHALGTLRTTQESLVQSEKMASLGQLVSGLAHEINGPAGVTLTAASHIAGRTEDQRRQFQTGSITRSMLATYLDEVCEASHLLVTNTERIASLVQMFKQVAADQAGDERRTFYLRDYIEDVLLSLHTQIGVSGHRVTIACPEALQVESYPGAFARVLTHLLRNALQHAFRPEQHGRINITVRPESEDWIEVEHADNGQGIDTADLPKIFDPFYTTARHTGGIGLGLHIAYNLATQTMGGQLQVESRAGLGTVFTLRLPQVAP